MNKTVKNVVLTTDMIPTERHPTSKWRTVTWPIEPYQYEPVWVSPGPRPFRWSPPPVAYFYKGPIGDHLIRIQPGDTESLTSLVKQFGLHELLEWTQERDLTAWNAIYSDYQSGRRSFAGTALRDAWTDPSTTKAFTLDLRPLQHAYTRAQKPGLNEHALSEILALAWEQHAVNFDPVPNYDTGTIVIRPAHIFARAWLELVTFVADRDLTPRTCPNCNEAFTPKRSNQDYCRAECRLRAADKRRNQVKRRKEYKKKNQQKQRGTITEADYDAWHDEWQRGN
jgi:hypothetical protein